MVSRCTDPNHRAFPNYGGRGISIYPPWLEDRKVFFEFAKTLENWDVPGLDLDRIDNAGNYEPGNLRICPRRENCDNKRNTLRITHDGHEYGYNEFWKKFCPDWSVNAVRYHLEQGKPPEAVVDFYQTQRAGVRPV
jgi:hypothetical protein